MPRVRQQCAQSIDITAISATIYRQCHQGIHIAVHSMSIYMPYVPTRYTYGASNWLAQLASEKRSVTMIHNVWRSRVGSPRARTGM